MSAIKRIDVVAALMRDGEKIFICQRPANKGRALQWEFPGGKIEPGEEPEEALIRECKEELAVELAVGKLYAETTHHYPDLSIHLLLFEAELIKGRPQMIEHNDQRWVRRDELGQYDFCPADQIFIEQLMKEA